MGSPFVAQMKRRMEAVGMRHRRTSRTLPAGGGPRPRMQSLQIFSSLTGLQILLSFSSGCIVGIFLFDQEDEIAKYLPTLARLRAMLHESSGQVLGYTYISFASCSLQNIDVDHGLTFCRPNEAKDGGGGNRTHVRRCRGGSPTCLVPVQDLARRCTPGRGNR